MITVTLSPQRIDAGQDTELTLTLTNVGVGTCRNVVFRLDLPWQIVRLSGNGQIEADRLPSGMSVRGSVRVRATDVGTWMVRSSNFSYRDRTGSTVRSPDASVGHLTVVPPAQVEDEPPKVTVDLVDSALPPERWSTLRIRLSNIGNTGVRDVGLAISGPLRTDNDGVTAPIPSLAPGAATEFPFAVYPDETGAVPVHIELTGRYGRQDQPVHERWTKNVVVGTSRPQPKPGATMTILYLSANPLGTDHLRLDAEFREIEHELAKRTVAEFHIEKRGAVRARDMSDALLNVRPRIVHFSGHGEDGHLYLERDRGNPHVVPPRAVAGLFAEAADYVECVVVNACSTLVLAEAIREHIEYAIAIKDDLPDHAAIAFSIGFYQALAAGESIEKAYRLGRRQIHLQLGDGFEDLAVLLRRRPSGGAGDSSF